MSAVAAGAALADESSQSVYTYADTVKWDAEYDVVVLGMGFAGMASAMSAADAGAGVLICEKCPEGEAGGNSRVCGQGFANTEGDREAALQYYTALTGGREVPQAVIEHIANGIADMQTLFSEKFGMNKEEFNKVREAEYPEFPGADKVGFWMTHDGSSDSYVYQYMRSRIATNYAGKIDVWFGAPAISLVQEPETGTIIGATVERNGETRNVRALNGVCLCVGGFEADDKMVQDYLGVINRAVIGGLYNTGDGIRMGIEVGARLWHMSVYEALTRQFLACGYYVDEGEHGITPTIPAEGSFLMVGTWGKRFGDENYTTRHGHVTEGNGLWENVHYPEKIFMVWDQAQMDDIEASGALDESFRDTIISCASVAEAAEAIGCDEANLQQTIDDFNSFAENGRDYEYARPAETMRAFDGAAYYVMPMRNMILNTQGGPERNEKGEVLDLEGNPIPHLYSAGELGAFTASMYQAGSNVAECFISGVTAGESAAAPKDDVLPDYVLAPMVESTPAHLGDETDLVAE